MKTRSIFFVFFLSIGTGLFAQSVSPEYQAYIAKYREVAIAKQTEHGIPAAITMAQGLLESGAGKSELAIHANNHFGIKCTSDWQGETYAHDDDRKNDCFRKYRKAEESYEDHSKFLKRPRYASLFDIPVTNYQAWAKGLSQCGYATDPKYPEKLIRIIEDYGLDQLAEDMPAEHVKVKKGERDTIYAADTVELSEPEVFREKALMDEVQLYHEHRSGYQDGLHYIVADAGESFSSLAYFLNMRERTLRRYNDALDGRELREGDRVYLFPKHRRASRKHATYYVKKGDTAWGISQRFAIKMKSIYAINGIPDGTPLTTRQMIRLR